MDHDNRSAVTGQFVTDAEAEAHPDTTVREQRDTLKEAVQEAINTLQAALDEYSR